jgi:L-aminopeptidase/D-esterase-like protein
MESAIRGGIGSALETLDSGVVVGALVAVNCWGDVIDPATGATVAAARGEAPGQFVPAIDVLRKGTRQSPFGAAENSTLAVVATDASLSKEDAYRMAVVAQTGFARTITPVHTPVDGDIVFALATGTNKEPADILQVGALAARAVERAVLRAVRSATSLPNLPAAHEWFEGRLS